MLLFSHLMNELSKLLCTRAQNPIFSHLKIPLLAILPSLSGIISFTLLIGFFPSICKHAFISLIAKKILSSSLISLWLLPHTSALMHSRSLWKHFVYLLSPFSYPLFSCEPTAVSGFYSCIAAKLQNCSFWGCPSSLHSSLPRPALRGVFFAYSVVSDIIDHSLFLEILGASLVSQTVKTLPAKQETRVRSLGREDPLEKGNDYTLQYSCLENSRDRGAWQATVHGAAKRRTWLSDFHFH